MEEILGVTPPQEAEADPSIGNSVVYERLMGLARSRYTPETSDIYLQGSVDEALDAIRAFGSTGNPLAIPVLRVWGTGASGFYYNGDENTRNIALTIPPYAEEKGYRPSVGLDLGRRLGMFPRHTSDKIVLPKRPFKSESDITDASYNVFPVHIPGARNVYWHELIWGDWAQQYAEALVTVNRVYPYVPKAFPGRGLLRFITRQKNPPPRW